MSCYLPILTMTSCMEGSTDLFHSLFFVSIKIVTGPSFHRPSTIVSTLFTFCPPLPPLRAVEKLISSITSIFIWLKIQGKLISMKVVIQRVSEASVKVEGEITGQINIGLLVFVGIEDSDTQDDVIWLAGKIVNIRIFNDQHGVMNNSVIDINGDILLVSQFTLHASTKKGNRPSYVKASKPSIAIPLYTNMIVELETLSCKKIQTGIFGADMKVNLLNDGPVTILIDTKNRE